MDTAPYSNILKAVGETADGDSAPKLTLEQQAQNYDTFSELMRKGVYLPDLLRRIEALESKASESPTERMDEELFAVMESAVKTDSDVRDARQRMADEKSRVINALCMQDAGYREASDRYRRAVSAAYVRKRESLE